MKNSHRILGWISFAIAVIAFIVQAVLKKSGIAYPGIAFFGMIEGGLLLFAAIMLMDPVRNEKAMKQLKTELRDERNTLIKGRAATTALFPVLCLLGVLSTYLFSKDMIVPGYLTLGIDIAGVLIFGISIYVIGKKM